MRSDKGQTYVLIGIGLMLVAIIVLYVGISQPKFVVETSSSVSQTSKAQYKSSNTIKHKDENVTPKENKSTRSRNINNSNNSNKTDKQYRYPINLNTATMDELQSIDGIGENRAWQIISYRKEIGRYTSVEQIKNISGIGDGIFNNIAPYLTV